MHTDDGETLALLPDAVFGGSYEHGAGRRRVLWVLTGLLAIAVVGTSTAAVV